jgi:hypothetical protein
MTFLCSNMTAPRSNKLPLSVDGHTIFAVSPLYIGIETDIIPQLLFVVVYSVSACPIFDVSPTCVQLTGMPHGLGDDDDDFYSPIQDILANKLGNLMMIKPRFPYKRGVRINILCVITMFHGHEAIL